MLFEQFISFFIFPENINFFVMVSRRYILKTIFTFVSASMLGKSFGMKSMNTKDKGLSDIRFAVASDGHFGQSETPSEMYYQNIVKWLNYETSENKLDFIIFNGDIIHDKPEYLEVVKGYFDNLAAPYYPVQGNHDMVTAAHWEKTWGVNVNHSFEAGNAAFILMATSNESGEYLCGDIDWLSKELDLYSPKKHIFVFLHISQKDWTRHGINCPDLLDLISRTNNISAVFHGHDHQEDDVKYHGNIPFFWSGHFGGSWGQEYKGYRIVEVSGNKVFTYMKNPLGRIELPGTEI